MYVLWDSTEDAQSLYYYYNISKPILMSSSSFSLPFSISNLHHRIYSLLSIQ